MKTKSALQHQIKFRPVYLSDLKPIREVYWDNESRDAISTDFLKTHKEIGFDFGIPLNLAEQDGKVVAYSFLNLTSNQEVQLNVFVDKNYKEEDIKKSLEAYSKSGNTNVYIDGSPNQLSDVPGIGNAINTLVNWLNSCLS